MIKYVMTKWADPDPQDLEMTTRSNTVANDACGNPFFRLMTVPKTEATNHEIVVVMMDVSQAELDLLEASTQVHVIDMALAAGGDVSNAVAFLEGKGARRPDFAQDRASLSMAHSWLADAAALIEQNISEV